MVFFPVDLLVTRIIITINFVIIVFVLILRIRYDDRIFYVTNTNRAYRASTSTRWHFAFALRCYSNTMRAAITNPPNSAQLEGIPTIPPSYIRIRAIVWTCGRRQTDTQTQVSTIHFAPSIRLTRNVISILTFLKSKFQLFFIIFIYLNNFYINCT